MDTKKNILIYITKNFLAGALIILGGISAIYGVIAFESLSTTPGTAGNQSLGSQILSIASGGGFDRTTDSLEALSNKISANEAKIDTNSTKLNTNATKLDTNSTDIGTVDTKVSALSGGGDFQNCETERIYTYNGTIQTITCSAGKSIRSHSFTCSGYYDGNARSCFLSNITTTSLSGRGAQDSNSYNYFSASILCCDD